MFAVYGKTMIGLKHIGVDHRFHRMFSRCLTAGIVQLVVHRDTPPYDKKTAIRNPDTQNCWKSNKLHKQNTKQLETLVSPAHTLFLIAVRGVLC